MSPDRSLATRAGQALHAAGGDAVVVRSPVAPLNAEPRVSAMQTSQALAGHALAVDSRDGDWLRVRGADDYAGWMHAGYVMDPAAALGDAGAGWYHGCEISLECAVRGPHGRRMLPVGAILLPGERCESGDVIGAAACRERFPPHAEAVVETAVRAFEGASYQWGGITPWGADCSGLVQSAFGLHGVPLPRDAWQQALEGASADDDPVALAAGDLLFFSDREDGRITHVGIAAGGGRMVHLALGRGGYAVDRLDDTSDPYVAMLRRNFRLARRLPLG
jgi:gamma-D-glutamyl-L-lysine dipeptidyl-peptidase